MEHLYIGGTTFEEGVDATRRCDGVAYVEVSALRGFGVRRLLSEATIAALMGLGEDTSDGARALQRSRRRKDRNKQQGRGEGVTGGGGARAGKVGAGSGSGGGGGGVEEGEKEEEGEEKKARGEGTGGVAEVAEDAVQYFIPPPRDPPPVAKHHKCSVQ